MREQFQPATVDHGTFRDYLATVRKAGGTKEDADSSWRYFKRCHYFRSETYQVAVDPEPEHGFGEDVTLWHLSIKRNDREAFHDWRVLQMIKNEICGRESEGFEIYPAESRLVDTANQYHLYVFMDEGQRIPCGFWERVVTGPNDKTTSILAPDAQQRAHS